MKKAEVNALNNLVFLIGNAHLDPVWLWRRTEGYAEIKSTFRSALDRMREFPAYVFTASSASYYKWIEESEPEMFEEIKQRVDEGRWIIAGGLWVQPDCNMPSGEAFARHMLYSQRYYKEKFGRICSFGYNVDSFGHNGMLPQLLTLGGMDSYVMMRPDKGENPGLPTGLFRWQSPDGSVVTTFRLPFGYGDCSLHDFDGAEERGLDKYEAKALASQAIADTIGFPMMSFYGVGNHGGGPTVRNLRSLDKLVAANPDAFCFSGPDGYFDFVRKTVEDAAVPVVNGDLQHHASGCYAANSTVKRKNRHSENVLLSAEKFDWLSANTTGSVLHTAALKTAWEKVMFNQFHDILAGCSIRSAYEEAYNAYGAACDTAWEVENFAIQRISWRINTKALFEHEGKRDGNAKFADNGDGAPFVVFNPHSFPVKAPVSFQHIAKSVCDSEGKPVPIQIVRAERTNGTDKFETMFMAEVPALGWSTYYHYYHEDAEAPALPSVHAQKLLLENDRLKITFDKYTGWIKSFYHKASGKEYAKAPMAKPVVIRDYEPDTWSHGVFSFREELGAFTDAEFKIIEEGPIRAAVRVTSYYNNSRLVQDFTLYAGSEELEVRCFLDFRESFKIVKLSFPADIQTDTAVYSMPYGFIQKSADGCEEHAHRWIAVCEETTGLALLNDSKYSFDVLGTDMRMAIARGCGFADHYGVRDDRMELQDQGEQAFTYVLMPFKAEGLSAVVNRAAVLNQPLPAVPETHHEGVLPVSAEGLCVSAENCVVEALKSAEDENGTILRLYETAGRPTTVKLELAVMGVAFETDLKAQQIKTFFINAADKSVTETDFMEWPRS